MTKTTSITSGSNRIHLVQMRAIPLRIKKQKIIWTIMKPKNTHGSGNGHDYTRTNI